jgi:hypothetical protein
MQKCLPLQEESGLQVKRFEAIHAQFIGLMMLPIAKETIGTKRALETSGIITAAVDAAVLQGRYLKHCGASESVHRYRLPEVLHVCARIRLPRVTGSGALCLSSDIHVVSGIVPRHDLNKALLPILAQNERRFHFHVFVTWSVEEPISGIKADAQSR